MDKQSSFVKSAVLTAWILLLFLLLIGAYPVSGQTSGGVDTPLSPGDLNRPDPVRDLPDVRDQLEDRARLLFDRNALGWDADTLHYLYRQVLSLPAKVPEFINAVMEQSRVLGVVGSAIVFLFILAVVYSMIGRKHVLARVEQLVRPVSQRLPEEVYPYFMIGLRSITSALLPLILFGVYYLIQGFIAYDAPWFLLLGKLLKLWTVGSLLISLANGLRDLIPNYRDEESVEKVFRRLQPVILFILVAIGITWGADSFNLREDFLALLRFVMSLSIVTIAFLFLLNKKGLLSLLPRLPYSGYQKLLKGLDRFYYPLIVLTFVTGLLWSFGFEHFSVVVWKKTWAILGVFVAFSVIYHVVMGKIKDWASRLDPADDDAQHFAHSLKSLILYITVLVVIIIMFDLLDLLEPISQLLSFTLYTVGESPVSMWILVKAVVIVAIFIYLARLVSSYLNYRIYPAIGVEPGFAYAINTFLKYFMLLIGVLVAMQIVGFDLGALYVFAGAIGIGLGFAMQTVASNIISGFVIIFGGKIRKGDWIEVEGTLGVVTDIFLRATKVRTRDNIEYIIPNETLMSTTIVNYSLSSPMIRIEVPFGVSYSADPKVVSNVVLEAARKEPSVMVHRAPEIRFVGYGDSSIDFEMLVWIDVHKTARRLARSRIYYAMFDALSEAGIEIPFPQRDLHLRSGFELQPAEQKEPAADMHRMPDQEDHSDLEEMAEAITKRK